MKLLNNFSRIFSRIFEGFFENSRDTNSVKFGSGFLWECKFGIGHCFSSEQSEAIFYQFLSSNDEPWTFFYLIYDCFCFFDKLNFFEILKIVCDKNKTRTDLFKEICEKKLKSKLLVLCVCVNRGYWWHNFRNFSKKNRGESESSEHKYLSKVNSDINLYITKIFASVLSPFRAAGMLDPHNLPLSFLGPPLAALHSMAEMKTANANNNNSNHGSTNGFHEQKVSPTQTTPLGPHGAANPHGIDTILSRPPPTTSSGINAMTTGMCACHQIIITIGIVAQNAPEFTTCEKRCTIKCPQQQLWLHALRLLIVLGGGGRGFISQQ